ncbi:MAG: SDR family oxidoreductase [Alphaproteobacteria bacterium]|nr:SDR family oxidoreductase [Alphaproteobacteria bacterium]
MKKVAIITGASTGIGRETAIAFADAGYKTYLLARSADKLQSVKQEAEDLGGEAVSVVVDLASRAALKAAIEKILAAEARIDAIVNVAGIWHGAEGVYAGIDFDKFSPEVIADTYAVGLIAPSMLINGLLPKMGKGSSIINISGTFADGGKGWLPYYVSKRALEDLTVGLAQDVAERGIRVNCISPSDTATESYAKYFPQYMDSAQEPSEVARFAVELCDSSSASGKVFVIKKDMEPAEGFHA